MIEADRKLRNASRLAECDPVFGARLSAVLVRLEQQGLRPRIQEAWRSPADQLKKLREGVSHVAFGFHNTANVDGTPAALAADVLDDDYPLTPRREFLLRLTRAAREHGLNTGLDWGLPESIRDALDDAAMEGKEWPAPRKIGWDPEHVEITGLTIEEAKAGKRP